VRTTDANGEVTLTKLSLRSLTPGIRIDVQDQPADRIAKVTRPLGATKPQKHC